MRFISGNCRLIGPYTKKKKDFFFLTELTAKVFGLILEFVFDLPPSLTSDDIWRIPPPGPHGYISSFEWPQG